MLCRFAVIGPICSLYCIFSVIYFSNVWLLMQFPVMCISKHTCISKYTYTYINNHSVGYLREKLTRWVLLIFTWTLQLIYIPLLLNATKFKRGTVTGCRLYIWFCHLMVSSDVCVHSCIEYAVDIFILAALHFSQECVSRTLPGPQMQ